MLVTTFSGRIDPSLIHPRSGGSQFGPKRPPPRRCRAARFQLSGSHSNRNLASPALGGCSFLRGGRAERHSAVQRIPRSHSSASLRSRSAMALSFSARASLRYRSARALLMASQIPTQQNKISSRGEDLVRGPPCMRWRRPARTQKPAD